MTTNTQLEETLHQALVALCPRVFPDVAPEGTETPYVVWHQLGGLAPQYTEGPMADRRNCLVQINVWHASRLVANKLSLDIEVALTTHPTLHAETQSAITAAYDEDVHLRGSMQDFSVWADR